MKIGSASPSNLLWNNGSSSKTKKASNSLFDDLVAVSSASSQRTSESNSNFSMNGPTSNFAVLESRLQFFRSCLPASIEGQIRISENFAIEEQIQILNSYGVESVCYAPGEFGFRSDSQEVRDAWFKAREATNGFDPLMSTDNQSGIVLSALFVKSFEWQQSLNLLYGFTEARTRVDNVFNDKDSAISLVKLALERHDSSIYTPYEGERKFYETFLAHFE